MPNAEGDTVTVCWICASPPTGGHDNVHTPPPIVAAAPEVVLVVSQLPRPRKNGSPMDVATAARLTSVSLIHTRILFAVSSIKAVSSFENTKRVSLAGASAITSP